MKKFVALNVYTNDEFEVIAYFQEQDLRIMPSTKGEDGTQMKLFEGNEFVVSIFHHNEDKDEMLLEINNTEIIHELLQHYFNRNNRIIA